MEYFMHVWNLSDPFPTCTMGARCRAIILFLLKNSLFKPSVRTVKINHKFSIKGYRYYILKNLGYIMELYTYISHCHSNVTLMWWHHWVLITGKHVIWPPPSNTTKNAVRKHQDSAQGTSGECMNEGKLVSVVIGVGVKWGVWGKTDCGKDVRVRWR